MKSSTALPALTRRMIRRGVFSFEHSSSTEWAPMMLVPILYQPEYGAVGVEWTFGLVLEEMVDLGGGSG
jgi:hypothetical protein